MWEVTVIWHGAESTDLPHSTLTVPAEHMPILLEMVNEFIDGKQAGGAVAFGARKVS